MTSYSNSLPPHFQLAGIRLDTIPGLNNERGAESPQVFLLVPLLPQPGAQREKPPEEINNAAEALCCCNCPKYLKDIVDFLTSIFKGLFKIIGIPLLILGAGLLIYGALQSALVFAITLSLAELLKSDAIITMIIGMLFYHIGNNMAHGKDVIITPADALYLPWKLPV